MPLPLVVAVALLGVAPAGLSVAVTTTPLWLTGLPLASSSWSTGCWANATPLCAVLDGAVVKATRPAAPVVPVAVNVTGLPVSPLDVAVSVFGPAVGPRVHSAEVRRAVVAGGTGGVGNHDKPPDATAKVTATPLTGLPLASCTITDGSTGTAVPAVAD